MNVFNVELMDLLRTGAREGKNVRDLVGIIRDRIDPFNPFVAMNFFMNAFNLTFSQVREMSGAICLGGGAYTDDEIDKIILPHIAEMLNPPS